MSPTLQLVPVSQMDLSGNVRTVFDSVEDASLAESADTIGIQQPPGFQKCGERFGLRFGGRRVLAQIAKGAKEVLALVWDETLSEADLIVIGLAENKHRLALNPMDEARAIKRLRDVSGLTAAAAAKRINYHDSEVSKLLAMLDAPVEIQRMLEAGEIVLSTAYAMTRKGVPEEQVMRAREAVAQKLPRAAVARKLKASQRMQQEIRRKVTLPVLPGWSLAVVGKAMSLSGVADTLTKAAEKARLAAENGLTLEAFIASLRKAKPAR